MFSDPDLLDADVARAVTVLRAPNIDTLTIIPQAD